MIEDIRQLVQSGDTYASVQRVTEEGTPRAIAERFQKLVSELYWQARDIPSVVAVAQGGIHYCLSRMNVDDNTERDYFGSHAKGLAYNLASFTWPGWDEAGIVLTSCDIACGMDAARLNLRLAIELGKPLDEVQNAHWLLGAHLLASNRAADAREEFRQCAPESHPLYAGYLLLADVILGASDAQQNFDDLMGSMRAQGDDQAEFARSQLGTAQRVFVGRG